MQPAARKTRHLASLILGGFSILALSACQAAYSSDYCIEALPTCDPERNEIDELFGIGSAAAVAALANAGPAFQPGPTFARDMRVLEMPKFGHLRVAERSVHLSGQQMSKLKDVPNAAVLAPNALRAILAQKIDSGSSVRIVGPVVGTLSNDKFFATNESAAIAHFQSSGNTAVAKIAVNTVRIDFAPDGQIRRVRLLFGIDHGLIKSVEAIYENGELTVNLELKIGSVTTTVQANDFLRRLFDGYIFERVSIDASKLNIATVGMPVVTVDVIAVLSADLWLSSGGFAETGLEFLPNRVAIRAHPFYVYVARELPALYVSRAFFYFRPEDGSHELTIYFGPSKGPKLTAYKILGFIPVKYQLREVGGHVRIFRAASGATQIDANSYLGYRLWGLAFNDHSATLRFEIKDDGRIGIKSFRVNRATVVFQFVAFVFRDTIADFLRDVRL